MPKILNFVRIEIHLIKVKINKNELVSLLIKKEGEIRQ